MVGLKVAAAIAGAVVLAGACAPSTPAEPAAPQPAPEATSAPGAADDATGLDASADGAVLWSGHTFGSFEGAGAGEADLLLGRLTLAS